MKDLCLRLRSDVGVSSDGGILSESEIMVESDSSVSCSPLRRAGLGLGSGQRSSSHLVVERCQVKVTSAPMSSL